MIKKIQLFAIIASVAVCLPVSAQNNNRGYYYPQNSMSPQTNNPKAPSPTYMDGTPYLAPNGQPAIYPQYGRYPYANQPGFGYYNANPLAPAYPAYGTPVPINGGLFRFNVGGFNGSYWKAPSGYYYPWGGGAVYANPAPIIVVEQGASQPAQPPVSDMLRDLGTYIDDQNTKKKFRAGDYEHLSRRQRDLISLESAMRSRNGGTLDQNDEEKIRRDAAMLSGDISRRILP